MFLDQMPSFGPVNTPAPSEDSRPEASSCRSGLFDVLSLPLQSELQHIHSLASIVWKKLLTKASQLLQHCSVLVHLVSGKDYMGFIWVDSVQWHLIQNCSVRICCGDV